MKFSRLFVLLFVMTFLSACSFTLAADVTPPPNYQPQAVIATQPAELAGSLYPLVPPNPADGEDIFVEKCAPCHGPTGQGDGPLAAELPFPAPAIGTAELARQAAPAEWYRIVTQGNMEKRMPPFTSLSERQRWDVVAYTLSLSTSQETIAQGEELYQANCARCHGEQGKGNGPDAAGLSTPLKDLTSQQLIASQPAAELFQAITAGVAPDMPAFGDQLSETERWAVTDYVRSLAFSGPRLASGGQVPAQVEETPLPGGTPQPVVAPATNEATLSATPAEAVGTVTGTVTNASGSELTSDLTVMLHGFDDMQTVMTQTTRVNAEGVFTFENVPMPEGRVFLTTIEFSGATYGSNIATIESGNTRVELPITIYETTTDASGLVVDRLHLFFEFTDPQTIRVIELYIINNPGNKTVVPAQEGEPVVTFKLPQGATNLEFQDGELGGRYVQTPDGFGDTAAVRPGSNSYQVLFAYEMPYDRKLDLVQTMTIPANAVVILVPQNSIKVKGDSLQDAGVRDVQGAQYQMYNSASLAAGDELKLTLSGRPPSSNPSLLNSSSTDLLVGLGALGVVLIVAGVWLYRRNRLATEDEDELEEDGVIDEAAVENPQTVMDAILALDDQYKAGELPEDVYRQRRAELKARLKELMS